MINKSDFENDLKQAMYSAFVDLGIKIPIRSKLDEMLLDYLTIRKKVIQPKPRIVLTSPNIEKTLLSHSKRKEVDRLKKLFIEGKNVNFFQSKKLFQTNFHDHLLYEWNIFHFHLSNEFERGSKFIKRTNQLLFAYIEDAQVIFLDIENHKKGIFADTKWLEILHNYFPKVLEPFKDCDIEDVSPSISSVERQTLWDKGYTLGITKINGTVYHSMGIGRAVTGHSILVRKQKNEILRWIYYLNDYFEIKEDKICSEFNIDKSNTEFKLQFGKTTLEIIEKKSNKILLTYPLLFNFN